MTGINREIVDVFLAILRKARRRNLEKAGIAEKTPARFADTEADYRMKIAETISLEDGSRA